MGRGRQKAKHTKVARELKYSVPETDYGQLERELGGSRGAEASQATQVDEISKWAEYLEDEDGEDEDGYGAIPQQKLA